MIRPPSSSTRAWRSISVRIASSTKRKEFKFLISFRIPSSWAPFFRSDTLASQRKWPFSMSPSETSTSGLWRRVRR